MNQSKIKNNSCLLFHTSIVFSICKSRRVLIVFISIPFGTEKLLGTLRFSEWKNYRQLINTMPLCAFSLHRFSDNFTRQLAGVCSLFYQQFSHLMGHGSSLLGEHCSSPPTQGE